MTYLALLLGTLITAFSALIASSFWTGYMAEYAEELVPVGRICLVVLSLTGYTLLYFGWQW